MKGYGLLSSSFKIKTPNNKTIILFYNKEDSDLEKIKILEDNVFNYIVLNRKFFEELNNASTKGEIRNLKNKYSKNNIYNYCLNHLDRDSVRKLLERCGTFILLKHFKNGFILTDGREGKENKARKTEIPVSNTSSKLYDMFFSQDAEGDTYTNQSKGNNLILTNESIMGNIELEDIYEIPSQKADKYQNTRHYKLRSLDKKDDIFIPRLYKILNKEIYTTEQYPEGLSENELNKWLNKAFKTVCGTNLYTYKTAKIKGNPNGIIDKTKPYTSKWCLLDAEGVFIYNKCKYKLSELVKQYQGKEVKINRRGEYETRYDMDKILVFEQDGIINFYDELINNINNNFIYSL